MSFNVCFPTLKPFPGLFNAGWWELEFDVYVGHETVSCRVIGSQFGHCCLAPTISRLFFVLLPAGNSMVSGRPVPAFPVNHPAVGAKAVPTTSRAGAGQICS